MGEQGDRSPHLGRAGVRTLDEVALTANERQAIEAAAATLRARFPVTDIVLYGAPTGRLCLQIRLRRCRPQEGLS